MDLTDKTWWHSWELQVEQVRLEYLKIAMEMFPPKNQYLRMFIWEDKNKNEWPIIGSRYGRSFAVSPFGVGTRGYRRPKNNGLPRKVNEKAIELKKQLDTKTRLLRNTIAQNLESKKYQQVAEILENFYWVKLGKHEIFYDGAINKRLEESQCNTVGDIRVHVINSIRCFESIDNKVIKKMNKELPGLSGSHTRNTYIKTLRWNSYACCAFSDGCVAFNSHRFISFKDVRTNVQKSNGSSLTVIRKLYEVFIDYKKPPFYDGKESCGGYSQKSMRKRKTAIYKVVDAALDKINRAQRAIEKRKNEIN